MGNRGIPGNLFPLALGTVKFVEMLSHKGVSFYSPGYHPEVVWGSCGLSG